MCTLFVLFIIPELFRSFEHVDELSFVLGCVSTVGRSAAAATGSGGFARKAVSLH